MIKAVIFDMDGVIIDSEKDYKQIEWDMYQELGLPISQEEAQESMGMVCLDWWTRLKERYGFEKSAKELADYEDDLYLKYLFSDEKEKPKMEGVEDVLKALGEKGYKVAVASSSVEKAIDRVLDIFDLDDYFDLKVSGQHVASGKPAPDIFLMTAEKLGVAPSECLVIEDSYNGIKAAKAAKMTCAAFLSAPEGVVDYSQADYLVPSFASFFDDITVLK